MIFLEKKIFIGRMVANQIIFGTSIFLFPKYLYFGRIVDQISLC